MARVTVVDEQVEFLDLMRVVLGAAGHTMRGLLANNASIERVAATRPDLLIVDLGRDEEASPNVALLRRLRGNRRLRAIPVVACSVDVRRAQSRLQDLGDVDLITKPFAITDMQALIARHVHPVRSSP